MIGDYNRIGNEDGGTVDGRELFLEVQYIWLKEWKQGRVGGAGDSREGGRSSGIDGEWKGGREGRRE